MVDTAHGELASKGMLGVGDKEGEDNSDFVDEESGRPGSSHWARDMRSLMQSFLQLFKHSR